MKTESNIAKEHEAEILLRGTVLVASVNLEVVLMRVVYFSNAEQYKNPSKSPTLLIKNLTFGGKIKRVKELIQEFHPDLVNTYQALFDDLDRFLEIRNKIAHCAIYWLDDDQKTLEIWDVAVGQNKMQFYSPTTYKQSDIVHSVIIWFGRISPDITSLANEVERRLKASDPGLHSALSSESQPPA